MSIATINNAEQLPRNSQGGSQSLICIVTTAPISCNPRVVKEADALTAAGFGVRVVASQHVEWAARWDAELMDERTWTLDPVRWDSSGLKAKTIRLASGLRHRGFQRLARNTESSIVRNRAYSRLYDELLTRATAKKADLFIAHNPGALPVAAAAADRFGVRFAFDSEDYHSGEFTDAERDTDAFRFLGELEMDYFPRCAYISSPSDQISTALASRYQIPTPITIPNVFAWSDRAKLDGKIKDRRGEALSVYWYSQIVGLNRGLQDVLRAASLLSAPIQIHVRGELTREVENELMRVAGDGSNQIVFHSPVHPDELLSRAAEHDVGLALEQPVNENRMLTVTNKMFFYMLAGLALAATDTQGQRGIFETNPQAGFIYEPGDIHSLAAGLQKLIDSPALLKHRKEASLAAARDRWNWEMEGQRLTKLVSETLAGEKEFSFVV